MLDQARFISDMMQFYDELNIKVPIVGTGHELEVIRRLTDDKIDVNCTCCFTSSQMILAANAGAKYVSIFYNRLLDIGGDPLREISDTRNVLERAGSKTMIIAGSIRNPSDVINAWKAGSHIVTANKQILDKMIAHPKSTESFNQFVADAKNLKLSGAIRSESGIKKALREEHVR
jgi:transaldolase